jgi:hypothetical protein
MNLKLLLTFSLGVSFSTLLSPSIVEAGYRRCQSYPNYTSACKDETGFEYHCTDDIAYTRGICTGKNNYRKECTYGKTTSVCNDSNNVRTVCKHAPNINTICENSKGFRSVCSFNPNGNYSICTDISRWGKPIKS